ncbi:hypothetical protein [Phenylobacterium sp.]|jgi:hypothetical protein|uniref:hypothetical protein n=1 Tax=Phenylobacterium sp. TaxID=1871053 RepID=UPI0011F7229B|nr:hypothetical protein [Phenylobacterium sp.]THD63136.1 MAG: hypothetical protein E8A12_08995 [Phenylobacterium sp.]
MHSARECREQADALATLALMFPEKAHAYQDAERRWRDLEARAIEVELRAPSVPPNPQLS